MTKLYALALIAALSFLMLTGAVLAQDGGKGSGNGASGVTIGQTASDFSLPDINGKNHSLASLKGKNGTVLIFISTQCPVVRAYIERIEKLAQDYRARGVNVIGINSNASESVDDMKAHATENHLTFTILRDKGNKVADMIGAQRTPEAFFFNASDKLVYHGRIDNSRNGENISSNDLRDAIDATLEGKPVTKTEASAFGCSIKRAS